MDKISETLVILDHIGRIIKSRADYCKRHIPFDTLEAVGSKMNEYIERGFEPKDLRTEEIANKISRECADIRIALHNYTRLNIIDMFSFNDEYNKFFNEKHIEDPELQIRILKVKRKNKNIRKKLNWDQLKRFRNVVMAHNLRDKHDSNKLSINILKEINELMMNHQKGVEYADVVINIFENIKLEFENEINLANQRFIEKARENN